jgi:hypothetical protein
MPRPLGDASGERLELPEYYADFPRHFRHTKEFWKLERGQVYAEPGDASWEAFNSGNWDESMRLLEEGREDLRQYLKGVEGAGTSARRIRIVSLPPTPYLQWELWALRIRDETGDPIRILDESTVARFEDQGPLPDISTLDTDVMYQVVYDEHGVLAYVLRYTEKPLVNRCRDFIAGLYHTGEPIASFFEREIAHLPPPQLTGPALPGDYLETTNRPRPSRS